MIKNKYVCIKLLILHMGLKTLSLRDNRLKRFTSKKSNWVEFIDETYKHKKDPCTVMFK
jgi:hypothetical protein